jgi:hypothetical protein
MEEGVAGCSDLVSVLQSGTKSDRPLLEERRSPIAYAYLETFVNVIDSLIIPNFSVQLLANTAIDGYIAYSKPDFNLQL